jgi:hypothetical protein
MRPIRAAAEDLLSREAPAPELANLLREGFEVRGEHVHFVRYLARAPHTATSTGPMGDEHHANSFHLDDVVATTSPDWFVGSRQSFRLPAEGYRAQIGVQKSVSSTTAQVKFTRNLSVISAPDWDRRRSRFPHGASKPSANIQWPCGWYARIVHVHAGRWAADR